MRKRGAKKSYGRINAIQLARKERDQQQQMLSFNSQAFVLGGPPMRRPRTSTLQYIRRNGRFKLAVVAHPEYGPAFGQEECGALWLKCFGYDDIA